MLWPTCLFLFHPRDMRGRGNGDVGQLLRHALKVNKFERRGKDAEKNPWENKHVNPVSRVVRSVCVSLFAPFAYHPFTLLKDARKPIHRGAVDGSVGKPYRFDPTTELTISGSLS